MIPHGFRLDSAAIPPGFRRDASSAATPTPTRPVTRKAGKAANASQFDPAPANELLHAARERQAARIAAIQAQRLDELSLIGHPTSFDPETRSVVETALRLAARGVLEA